MRILMGKIYSGLGLFSTFEQVMTYLPEIAQHLTFNILLNTLFFDLDLYLLGVSGMAENPIREFLQSICLYKGH